MSKIFDKKKTLFSLLFVVFAVTQPYAWGADKEEKHEEQQQAASASCARLSALQTPPLNRVNSSAPSTNRKVTVPTENTCCDILNALNSQEEVDGVVAKVNQAFVHYLNKIPYSATMGSGLTEKQAFEVLFKALDTNNEKLISDKKKWSSEWKTYLKTTLTNGIISDDDIQFLRKKEFFNAQFCLLCKCLSLCTGNTDGAVWYNEKTGRSTICFATGTKNYVLQFVAIPGKDTKLFTGERNLAQECRTTPPFLYKFNNNNQTTVIDFNLPAQKPYELDVAHYTYDDATVDDIAKNMKSTEIINASCAKAPLYSSNKNIFKDIFSNAQRAKEVLEKLFNTIPTKWLVKAKAKENFYKNLFFCVSKFATSNALTSTEVCEKDGRIDVYIESENLIEIVEFKFDNGKQETTADAAIQQIKDDGYAESHRYSGKKIHLIGISIANNNGKVAVTIKSEPYNPPPIEPAKKLVFKQQSTSSSSSSSSSSTSSWVLVPAPVTTSSLSIHLDLNVDDTSSPSSSSSTAAATTSTAAASATTTTSSASNTVATLTPTLTSAMATASSTNSTASAPNSNNQNKNNKKRAPTTSPTNIHTAPRSNNKHQRSTQSGQWLNSQSPPDSAVSSTTTTSTAAATTSSLMYPATWMTLAQKTSQQQDDSTTAANNNYDNNNNSDDASSNSDDNDANSGNDDQDNDPDYNDGDV